MIVREWWLLSGHELRSRTWKSGRDRHRREGEIEVE